MALTPAANSFVALECTRSLSRFRIVSGGLCDQAELEERQRHLDAETRKLEEQRHRAQAEATKLDELNKLATAEIQVQKQLAQAELEEQRRQAQVELETHKRQAREELEEQKRQAQAVLEQQKQQAAASGVTDLALDRKHLDMDVTLKPSVGGVD